MVAGDDAGGPGDLLQAALDAPGYLAELEAEDTVESAGRLENLGELVGSAREFTASTSSSSRSPSSPTPTSSTSDDQVVLMTLHSAKGLEFPSCSSRRRGGRVPAHAGRSPSPTSWRRNGASPTSASPAPRSGCTSPTPGAAACSGRRSTTRRRGSSRRSPPSWSSRRATSPGALRTAARASARASDWGAPPPYRRRRGGAGDEEREQRRSDAHRDRVVDAALAAGRRNAPVPSDAHDIGLRIGDDVEHPAFGEGVIIDMRGQGEPAEATVNFPGVGTKHLALAWAPLESATTICAPGPPPGSERDLVHVSNVEVSRRHSGIGRRSTSQPIGAWSTAKPKDRGDPAGDRVPIVGVVDRPLGAVAERVFRRLPVPGDVVIGAVGIERQHEAFPGRAELARRSVEGRERDALDGGVESVSGVRVGRAVHGSCATNSPVSAAPAPSSTASAPIPKVATTPSRARSSALPTPRCGATATITAGMAARAANPAAIANAGGTKRVTASVTCPSARHLPSHCVVASAPRSSNSPARSGTWPRGASSIAVRSAQVTGILSASGSSVSSIVWVAPSVARSIPASRLDDSTGAITRARERARRDGRRP